MLTRVHIQNYRCFVNFDYRPARKQLILGGNGSGKSSFIDALTALRQFAILGMKAEEAFPLSTRTRWLDQTDQIFELEVELDERLYTYLLVLDKRGSQSQTTRVVSETVRCDSKPIFECEMGMVQLYSDDFEKTFSYPFGTNRSALEITTEEGNNQLLTRFKTWLGGLLCFKINPYGMGSEANGKEVLPAVDFSNFAAWYRKFDIHDPRNQAMKNSLAGSLSAFGLLSYERAGESIWLLKADFDYFGAKGASFSFSELSEGQRCLICLYAILHFLINNGNTVILDEPDNFVSLREIQPWLTAVSDAVEDGHGQVLLISHHPEIIDQWAAASGVRFVRKDGVGPVHAEEFRGDPDSCLPASELIARGWDND